MDKNGKPGLLSTVKGKVAIFVAFVAALAAFLGNLTSIKNFFSSKREIFTLKGVVINSKKNPVEKAKVTLRLWSNKIDDSIIFFTAQNGEFSFNDLNRKNYDSISIKAVWKSDQVEHLDKFIYSSSENVSLTFPTTTKPAIENPLVCRFYWLKGHAIDYLLEGKIDSTWGPGLAKNPIIIKNQIFNTLSQLKLDFSIQKKFTPTFTKINKGNKISRQLSYNSTPKYLLAGTIKYDEALNAPGTGSDAELNMDRKDFIDLVGINLVRKAETKVDFGYPSIHLVITKKQLDKLVEINGHYDDSTKLINLLSYITKDYYPDGFIEAMVGKDECVGEYFIVLYPPALSLKLGLIESKDNSKVYSLGNFTVKESSDTTLRLLTSSNSASKIEERNYFPQIKMNSDDKIIVPLRILFETLKGLWYEYGRSDSLVSTIVDEDDYKIREEPYNAIYVRDNYAGGSCPYIFTRESAQSTWQKENHILYGFHDKSKEAEQALTLKHFDGKLQIRELDPETSYIDEVYIKHTDERGNTEIILPQNNLLMHREGKYLIMHTGDIVELNFAKKINPKEPIEVVAYGYYVRNTRRKIK